VLFGLCGNPGYLSFEFGEGMGSRTFATWLYVANGVGVEEKLRRRKGGDEVGFARYDGKGIRMDGMRNLRSIRTAIVVLVV
jgi:hypothetical protein